MSESERVTVGTGTNGLCAGNFCVEKFLCSFPSRVVYDGDFKMFLELAWICFGFVLAWLEALVGVFEREYWSV